MRNYITKLRCNLRMLPDAYHMEYEFDREGLVVSPDPVSVFFFESMLELSPAFCQFLRSQCRSLFVLSVSCSFPERRPDRVLRVCLTRMRGLQCWSCPGDRGCSERKKQEISDDDRKRGQPVKAKLQNVANALKIASL